jgi:hypothetical protein
LSRNRWAQWGTSIHRSTYAGDQDFRLDVFDEVATRPRSERRRDLPWLLKGRECDHRDLGVAGRQAADCGDPVDDWHLQVHQHHVGRQSAR